ncbi:FAD-binding oxidoreductase [Allonocardiopsis opalescens]|uniref:4-cresol dehydrogenase (Hydroxylating) n=1 Tax=Allonocardiopsis opalescens TaxID=1144618 RepID=A0A2T0QB20_9ACTN|nr:FAD-binding oxidoreductase [Allonocardiopsis opalescens]PRY01015.1 4-cresol dehydrogenase (hydroxylating) [Allonocardiopsis opalescens]
MVRKLPPGLNEQSFADAVASFRRAVGDKWVIDDDAQLANYRDPFAVLDPEHLTASAVVMPASVEEVQAVLAVANDTGVPLSPVSIGKNLGYGGPAPRLPGAVVVDLKRMNRILEVNEKFGYALVEPGVSFMELDNYLRERGIDFWVDVPDLGWGSVLGNTLERGVGYTAYGDHFAIQCGMEVVLADGDVVRTGMGGVPGSSTAQLFKYGFGPVYDGIFTQSNFGIVTKMGLWLLPKPPGYQAYMITLAHEEDLGPFVEILRTLKMNGTITNVPSLRSVLLDAAAVAPRSHFYSGTGPVPDSVSRKIMADLNIGWWNFYGAMYGPQASIDLQWQTVRDAFSTIPGASFYLAGEHDSPVLATRAKVMACQPNLETADIFQWFDNGGHVDFAPLSPATSEDALSQYAMVRDACLEFGKDYMGNWIVGRREMHHIQMTMFDTKDPDDRTRTLAFTKQLIRQAAERGYGAYRAHPAIMDEVAATFSFNDGALMRLSERVKDALDPKGILAPGKQGIWPKSLRGKGL